MTFRKLDSESLKKINPAEEIVVVTQDECQYALPRVAINQSKLLTDLLEEQAGDERAEVPLANVDAVAFELVAEYLTHYAGSVKPATLDKPLKAPLPSLLSEWDHDYVYKKLFKNENEKEHEMLFKALLAANFLAIDSLRDLCCAAIANMLRGKTPEQIMEVFGVTEPFTAEEERLVEEAYPWLREAPPS
eukprot:NODE_3374_length_989_cov_45.597872_g3101_i0.p1 GENE.NODE_3374_length_989_cov_45.597872_g3101_i0~~NODE_3374_length_989_cov_45.597872_g3101_i0.p1  ORF type:complete len:190 (-),score=50.16 NODE_3374_length_989_cov_45.597872_g3101_i0:185-754(-)